MARPRTKDTYRLNQSQEPKKSRKMLALYALGLWVPYWLWSENKMAEVAKPALREYFKTHCGQGMTGVESFKKQIFNSDLNNSTDDMVAICANQEITFISANIGLFRSTAAYWIALDRTQPPIRRYFRIKLNLSDQNWEVVEEISPKSYNFAF